jgi:hypothetical protein
LPFPLPPFDPSLEPWIAVGEKAKKKRKKKKKKKEEKLRQAKHIRKPFRSLLSWTFSRSLTSLV